MFRKLCNKFGINTIVFRRFFFRKKSDNTNDIFLTLVFVIFISLSAALVFRSGVEIYKYETKINQFVDNEWNKLYNLYLEDCFDFEAKTAEEVKTKEVSESVLNYLDSLSTLDHINVNSGTRRYPTLITIKSKNGILPKIQCFQFNDDYKFIINRLTETFQDSLISKKPYIFLQNRLKQKLKVKDDDIVFAKKAGIGNKYEIPLKVKPIKEKSRIKCFIFSNYLWPKSYEEKIKVRLYFKNQNKLFNFLFKDAVLDWQLDEVEHIYIGLENLIFGAFVDGEIELCDKIYPLNTIEKQLSVSFSDSIKINFILDGENHNFKKLARKNQPLILKHEEIFQNYLIDKNDFDKNKFNKTDIVVNLLDNNSKGSVRYFLQYYFQKNFSGVSAKDNQLMLINKYIDLCDSIQILSNPKDREKINTYKFINYDRFQEDPILSEKILKQFDDFNVRWDSGRWKTIIDLNKTLNEGKKNILFLLLINAVIFCLFLIIKLYLRLKLEFHSIGTIRCFGFKKTKINKIYRIGYSLLISLGFIFGIILGIIISLISGFELYLVMNSTGFVLFNYLLIYFFALQVITYFVVGIILNNMVYIDDIYGLIKYES